MTKGEKILKDVKQEAKADAKANKQPKTIKLTTLAIIVVSLIAGFFGGIVYQDNFQWQVEHKAKALIKSLK